MVDKPDPKNEPSILIARSQKPGTDQDTELWMRFTNDGINLVLQSDRVNATSDTFPWRNLAWDIVKKDPYLFGDFREPLHQDFKFALEDIGFPVDGTPDSNQ